MKFLDFAKKEEESLIFDSKKDFLTNSLSSTGSSFALGVFKNKRTF